MWVKAGEEWLPGYNRFRLWNWNLRAIRAAVRDLEDTKKEVLWGTLSSDLGYLAIQ